MPVRVCWLLLLVAAGPCLGGSLTVEIGLRGEAVAERVEAPNLALAGPAWNAASPGPLPELPPGAAPEEPLPAPAERFEHLAGPAESAGPPGPAGPSGLDGLVADGPAPEVAVLAGAGERTYTATSDGTAVLEPLLRTRAGANMVVRLLDESGVEMQFDGKSLLEWRRPDDTANAPLSFQGRARGESMELVGEGDYTPREGLRYSVPLKRGQRIEIVVDGAPLPESRIAIRSDVLRSE